MTKLMICGSEMALDFISNLNKLAATPTCFSRDNFMLCLYHRSSLSIAKNVNFIVECHGRGSNL